MRTDRKHIASYAGCAEGSAISAIEYKKKNPNADHQEVASRVGISPAQANLILKLESGVPDTERFSRKYN